MMYLFPSWRKNRYAFLKNHDDWWTVIVLDLLAIPATIVLAKLRKHAKKITPNGVSLVSFMAFCLGVVLMFVRPDSNAYFTFCFFLSCLLDSVDGKLARLLGEASQFGEIVDGFFDMLKTSLGLMLVGIALSMKSDSPYPLMVLLPYSLFLGVGQINRITRLVTGRHTYLEQEVSHNEKSKWRLFCDKRGLAYGVCDVEIIYIVILLIGINLKNPTLFMFVGIYLKSVFWIWKRFIKKAVNTSACGNKL
jgi:phosphatidylglycerophosphate synthase